MESYHYTESFSTAILLHSLKFFLVNICQKQIFTVFLVQLFCFYRNSYLQMFFKVGVLEN